MKLSISFHRNRVEIIEDISENTKAIATIYYNINKDTDIKDRVLNYLGILTSKFLEGSSDGKEMDSKSY